MPPNIERRQSKRLERRNSGGPYDTSKASGSTGLTSYMGKTTLDWDDGASADKSFARKKAKEPKLPKNWKKAKESDGTTYYINTVTQQRSHELPPTLPAGWNEALHKDSGRVYYYNKATRQSTFEFPTEPAGGGGGDAMDDDDDDPLPAPEGNLFSRTFSRFSKKGKDDKSGISRTTTMGRSFKPGTKKPAAKAPAADKGAEDSTSKPGAQKTVFISCSTLIKEVKLCVSDDRQPALDELYQKLTSHQIPAEQAVKNLMELVGSTIVQQAGLSVMNSQKGTLPHGWLEYTDDASGRAYYFNVHTKVTTWYKPTGAVPPPPPKDERAERAERRLSADHVQLECSVENHNVAMTGFI